MSDAPLTAPQNQLFARNITSLSNITDLVSSVILNIAGNDLSTSLNENRLTKAAICLLAQNRVRDNLSRGTVC